MAASLAAGLTLITSCSVKLIENEKSSEYNNTIHRGMTTHNFTVIDNKLNKVLKNEDDIIKQLKTLSEQNEKTLVNPDNIMAIDLGVENLATCVSNVETPFIMDGRKLKSINQYWNKDKARLQSIAMKQGMRTTHQINRITIKRNNCVNVIPNN